MKETTKCLIIGSGPAGYTAAIYASRANLKPILIEGLLPGGQLTQTTTVENFPGYPEGVGGFEMMDDMRNQALKFGTDIRSGFVTKVSLEGKKKSVIVDDEIEIEADSVSSEEEFIDIAVSQLSYLKDDVIIHRLGADSATDDLIAPCWVRKKMSIVDKIDTFMKDNDIFQADNY